MAYDVTVGIPNGRRLRLPGLGMYTRLTGMALNGSVPVHPVGQLLLASGVSATSPSTPAVRRPALRSVTRRTLTSVFACDRNINFCRRRTRFRSPALDAVKIRCRNRRTSSSTRRQSTGSQSKLASSGPFTATFVVASNLSSGSGASVIFLLTGSPDRVSTLSGRITRAVSGQLSKTTTWRGWSSSPGFPLRFRHRHSLLGHPIPAGELGPPHGRLTGQTAGPDGVTAFRTHEQRPGWAPSIPRGRRCSSRTGRTAQPAPAALPRLVLQPRSNIPPCEAPLDEASTRVQAIHPSGLPLARGRPDGTGRRLGFPPSFAPRRPGAGRRTSRWGQAIEHGPGTTRSTSHRVDPPIQ